jgi:hypothetical protein
MKRKSSAQPRAYSGSSLSWKMNYKRERVMHHQSQ